MATSTTRRPKIQAMLAGLSMVFSIICVIAIRETPGQDATILTPVEILAVVTLFTWLAVAILAKIIMFLEATLPNGERFSNISTSLSWLSISTWAFLLILVCTALRMEGHGKSNDNLGALAEFEVIVSFFSMFLVDIYNATRSRPT